MDGEARLVVEAREDVRIEMAEVARGEAAVIAEALRRLQRRLRDLPVRRPRRARRGRPQAAGLGARVPAVPRAVDRVSRFQAAADFSHQNRYMFSNRNGFSSSNARPILECARPGLERITPPEHRLAFLGELEAAKRQAARPSRKRAISSRLRVCSLTCSSMSRNDLGVPEVDELSCIASLLVLAASAAPAGKRAELHHRSRDQDRPDRLAVRSDCAARWCCRARAA